MTGDQAAAAALYGLMLLLPLSALAARRIAWRRSVTMALAWVAIFAVTLVILAERDRIVRVADDVRLALNPEAGERRGAELRIPMAADGHFWVRAQVNHVPLRFLVDSGATTTALGTAAAEQAHVAQDTGFGGGIGVPLETANGTVVARHATIGRLALDGIERRDLSVMVAPEFGVTNVLGMNFLSSLSRWSVEGRTLVLVS